MTYCLAISLNSGLVFCSDSRTNAGVDNVSTYSKMHTFGTDGDRQFVLLSAGNLATTQGVVAQLQKDIRVGAPMNLFNAQTITDAADYVGAVNQQKERQHVSDGGIFEASFIFGGQIAGQPPEAHLIYPQGNHITTSDDTPYLQIGESKYGKPILDRILHPDSNLETATLCALVSMDSTMRSNLTVGPPIELIIYDRDSLQLNRRYRFEPGSNYLRELSVRWDDALKNAFHSMPPISWGQNWDTAAGRKS
jgi:putative proteasome-type protease